MSARAGNSGHDQLIGQSQPGPVARIGIAASAPRAGLRPLSEPEREIVHLAAAGLTNKEIGRRLLLSHRTVGAHLYRAFPKLGVRSRAALRDALACRRLEAAAWPEGPRTELHAPGGLTSREHVVAKLAATGLTNKQIAERLQMSHRTVGAHLRQVFRKLEVSARAGLRDGLARCA